MKNVSELQRKIERLRAEARTAPTPQQRADAKERLAVALSQLLA